MNSASLPQCSSTVFEWTIRVYYEDTDAGGIVFYANYLKFFERARTEWLRLGGIDQREWGERLGTMFVVRHTAVEYRAPARLDDVLRIESRVARFGGASVDFAQTAWRDDTRLCTGTIQVACVRTSDLRPTPLPSQVTAALQQPMQAN